MNIRFLGAHNTDSLTSRNLSLLIDGVIALDAGGLTYALTLAEQRRIKGVFLTHQHYDHIRDLPGIAIVFYHSRMNLGVYATQVVCDALSSHIFDGALYPKFLERPPENPTVKFTVVEPGKPVQIDSYRILPVSVNHAVPSVGYEVTSPEGKKFFYTGDTGQDLGSTWEKVSPELLIIEVTLSNRHEALARDPKHLTPELLRQELLTFQRLKGYLPRVVVVHMAPEDEEEIRAEIGPVSRELDCPITLAREGMEVSL